MIAENLYGLPKLFDKIDYEDMQLINIEEVYQWYLKNNKIPSPNAKEIEEKRLGKRRS
jgi:hypothetical protein